MSDRTPPISLGTFFNNVRSLLIHTQKQGAHIQTLTEEGRQQVEKIVKLTSQAERLIADLEEARNQAKSADELLRGINEEVAVLNREIEAALK